MKALHRRRLEREVRKRTAVTAGEKRARLTRFSQLAGSRPANGYRLAVLLLRRGHRARSAACRRHCLLTGRGSSVYRFFRLSRHSVRECFHRGELFGVRKASWLQPGHQRISGSSPETAGDDQRRRSGAPPLPATLANPIPQELPGGELLRGPSLPLAPAPPPHTPPESSSPAPALRRPPGRPPPFGGGPKRSAAGGPGTPPGRTTPVPGTSYATPKNRRTEGTAAAGPRKGCPPLCPAPSLHLPSPQKQTEGRGEG